MLALALSLIMIASISGSIVEVSAQNRGSIDFCYAYAAATPNPVGVGGTVYISGWVSPPPYVIGAVFNNFTFVVTLPDGTKTTKYFPTSDIDGSQSYSFTCTQAGIYTVELNYPGDLTHKSVNKVPYKWTCLQGYTVPTYSSTPLPTGYWKFPINAQDYDWFWLSGGWLWAGQRLGYDTSNTNFNPYSKGPNTSHILYALPMDIGGLMGGQAGALSNNPLVGGKGGGTAIWNSLQGISANGRYYYTTSEGNTNNSITLLHPVLHCIDLETGETIYDSALPTDGVHSGSGGQMALQMDPFVKGVGADQNESATPRTYFYNLWIQGGGLWQVNPLNGDCLYYTYTNVTGTGLYQDDHWYIWNAGVARCFDTITKQFDWTVNDPFQWASGWSPGWAQISHDPKVIVEEDSGQQLFNIRTRNVTTGAQILNVTFNIASGEKPGCIADGMLYWHMIDGCVYAFSLTTGQQVWKSQSNGLPWGAFGTYWSSAAYGNVFFGTWDGYIRCYNGKTGAVVWQYFTGNTTETGTGNYIPWGNAVIADGKIYFATGQHTPPEPLPRGDQLVCIDANTGKLIWSYPFQSGWGGIAAGKLYYTNNYDGLLYVFDMGKTATTVSVSQNPVTLGSSTVIQGTITDQSPGQKGTPCVSAESMTAQMKYIYANAPQPTNAAGVPVVLTAIGPDNNIINIGTATSDASGNYAIMWAPPSKGLYKVMATFYSDASYWGSWAETALGVVAAPSAAPAATPTPATTVTPNPTTPSQTASASSSPSPSQAPQPDSGVPMTTYVAIAAFTVIIIVLAAALVLRKRK